MIYLSVDVEPDFPPYLNTDYGIEGLKKIHGLLKKHNCDAAMFVCADFFEKEEQVRKYTRDYEIGCHGLRHVDLTKLNNLQLQGEIHEAIEIFAEHEIKPRGFRAPYARVDKRVMTIISKYFEYDSSLMFYSLKKFRNIKEVPIFIGGKTFGISPGLFNLLLKFPKRDKVFFIHPWEFGGLNFELIYERRRNMRKWGYSAENYFTNLEKLLEKGTKRLSELL